MAIACGFAQSLSCDIAACGFIDSPFGIACVAISFLLKSGLAIASLPAGTDTLARRFARVGRMQPEDRMVLFLRAWDR